MLKTAIWFSAFAISLLFETPNLYKVKKQEKSLSKNELAILADKHVSRWAALQLKNTGARIQVEGMSNIPDEPVLFVSNHQSNFDIPIFLGLVKKPKGFIAKVETQKMPLIRTWMYYIRCVFMDRDDMRKSAQAIIDGINILKDGHSMVVFPEGTRSKGDNMLEFKAGSFKLCTKSKVPVVPVTISGSYKIFEQGNNRIRPADVKVVIHKPIYTKDLDPKEIAALPERVKEIIASAI